MKIGILYEGDYDQEPFSILLKRIVSHSNPQFVLYAANGNISSKVDTALKLFFEVDSPCKMAIFINDMDNKKERCRSIKAKVTRYKQKNPDINICVLCPDPSFERWFFEEENALRKVLSLPMADKIPYPSLHPKIRLEKLIYEYNEDFTRSRMDIYKEIAETINIQNLTLRNKEFKKMHNELIK